MIDSIGSASREQGLSRVSIIDRGMIKDGAGAAGRLSPSGGDGKRIAADRNWGLSKGEK